MPDIKSVTREELAAFLAGWEQPAYRAGQILNWLYARRATRWEQMSNLPRPLRQKLADNFSLHALELVKLQGAADSTRKFLWRLHDGALIESVLIPANPALYGEPSDRHTLCVSTQVGCAYGCKFCASGLDGWKRNLTADEIVEQVLAVERWQARETAAATAPGTPALAEAASETASPSVAPAAAPLRLVNNLVVMGMGEPLANYEQLLKGLRILNAPWGGGIGARKITVSTSGLVPEIRRLASETMQIRLAISLHAATDEVRSRLMPVNRKYPLAQLVAACESYLAGKGRMITFEYILIAGVNDSPEQARRLDVLARRLRAKVNLIPYNHVEGLAWQRPSEPAQQAFLKELIRAGVKTTLRHEKGEDIDAACGQLRLKAERESGLLGSRGDRR
jgi:23S rRNA (adenine2503-C2)-methyltransferase